MKIAILRIFLSTFLILYLVNAFTQSKSIDSIQKILQTQKEDTNKVNTLNNFVNRFIDRDSSFLVMPFAIKAKFISENLNYSTGKALANYNLGRLYLSQDKYSESLNGFLSAKKIYLELKDKATLANVYGFISYIYARQYNLSESLQNQYNSLKIYEELKDSENVAISLQAIANIYRGLENNDEALKNFVASLKIYENLGNRQGIAEAYQGIANIYIDEEKFSEALAKNSAALEIFQQLNDDWSVAWCLSSIGKIYERQGFESSEARNKALANAKFSEASRNYSSALQIFKNMQSHNDIIKIYYKLGNINIQLKKFNEARGFLNKSLEMATKANDIETLKNSYGGLSQLDSIEGNYVVALDRYKKHILFRDSLIGQETAKKSLQIKMQYEFDKKEAVGKAEQAKKDADVKRIKNLQYVAIGGLGVIIIAVLLIAFIQWRNNKQKQQANVLLQLQKEKVESALTELKSTQSQLIQSEKMASLGELTAGIAHEIQNPLNFVNNFSEVNTELIDELKTELTTGNHQQAIEIANNIKENEEKINHHGKRADAIVKGMLQHSRSNGGQKELTDINALADEYLRLAYHGIRAKDKEFNATIETDFDKSIGNVKVVPQDIGRVILNLITNAFYAVTEKKKQHPENYEPIVTVSTKRLEGKVEIRVEDNGNGIPQKVLDKIFQPFFTTKPTGQGTGLGLSLSYDIVKAHGGEIKVEAKNGEGSEFIIQIQIPT